MPLRENAPTASLTAIAKDATEFPKGHIRLGDAMALMLMECGHILVHS